MSDSPRYLFPLRQNRHKEFPKPLVLGGALSPISFAAERNGAAGGAGIEEALRHILPYLAHILPPVI